MANPLASLVVQNGSQESFHSVGSQPAESPDNNVLLKANHGAPVKAFDLPVYDIESYLGDPKNGSLLDKSTNTATKASASRSSKQSASNGSVEPVSLGSKTSHHVSALMQLCQLKGLKAEFDINGDASNADFGGTLRIGDNEILSDEHWHSKKEAKEALAQKGIEAARGMESTKNVNAEVTKKNWVGMLQEYHSFLEPSTGPDYEFYGLDLLFGCTCTSPHIPARTFGSSKPTYPSKKVARSASAKEAVEHLISNNELNSDGSTKGRKRIKLGSTVRVKAKGLEVKKGASFGQKVQDLCPMLGLTSPQYVMAPKSASALNILSGYASFTAQPGMPERIAEVRNVFGKKNAKEEIAKGLWEELLKLAEKRGVKLGEEQDGSLI